MKFTELMDGFKDKPENVQRVFEKLEKQFFKACEKNLVPQGEEVILRTKTSKDHPSFFYFEYESHRISPYMLVIPSGDLVLTENPENYSSVQQVFNGITLN